MFYADALEYTLCMQGDRQESIPRPCDPEYIGSFETIEDAVAAAREWMKENPRTIHYHRRPFGSITYHDIDIARGIVDEDGEEYDVETVEILSTLDDSTREAWDKARDAYWGYLDNPWTCRFVPTLEDLIPPTDPE